MADGSRRRVTTREISEGLGLTYDAVVHYFGNTDNLVWDIVARHVNLLLQRMHDAAPDAMAPGERWGALAGAYAETVGEHAAEHRTAIAFAQHLDGRRHGDARILQRYILQDFIDALRGAAPSCPAGLVTPLALSLLAMLNAQAAWFRGGGGLGRVAYAEMAAAMVLREAQRAAAPGGPAEEGGPSSRLEPAGKAGRAAARTRRPVRAAPHVAAE